MLDEEIMTFQCLNLSSIMFELVIHFLSHKLRCRFPKVNFAPLLNSPPQCRKKSIIFSYNVNQSCLLGTHLIVQFIYNMWSFTERHASCLYRIVNVLTTGNIATATGGVPPTLWKWGVQHSENEGSNTLKMRGRENNGPESHESAAAHGVLDHLVSSFR